MSGYASAVLTATYYWEPIAAFAVGLGLALLVALVVGWPTLRLKGHYLAMATLAIGLIVYEIAIQWQSVTQGYMGISGIAPLGIAGYEIVSERGKLFALVVIVALASLAAARLRASRFGRALAAIAGSEDAARALGIEVARYKLAAFLVSAAYAALAGSLFVHVVEFVSPEVFGLHMVVLAFTMLYVGGIGTIGGPILGAVIVSLLPEMFRGLKDYQDLFYGAGLILLLIYAPKGLAGLGNLMSRGGKRMTLLVAAGRDAAVRRPRRRRRRRSRGRRRRRHRRDRPERRGQDHAVQPDFRVPDAERRAHRVRGRGHHRACRPSRSQRRVSFAPSSSCSCSRIFRCWRTSRSAAICTPRAGCFRRCCAAAARGRPSARSRRAPASCSHFVGLEGAAELEASALAYGQQRLLEIARGACRQAQAAAARRARGRPFRG